MVSDINKKRIQEMLMHENPEEISLILESYTKLTLQDIKELDVLLDTGHINQASRLLRRKTLDNQKAV